MPLKSIIKDVLFIEHSNSTGKEKMTQTIFRWNEPFIKIIVESCQSRQSCQKVDSR